jgi:hypothetical protein
MATLQWLAALLALYWALSLASSLISRSRKSGLLKEAKSPLAQESSNTPKGIDIHIEDQLYQSQVADNIKSQQSFTPTWKSSTSRIFNRSMNISIGPWFQKSPGGHGTTGRTM